MEIICHCFYRTSIGMCALVSAAVACFLFLEDFRTRILFLSAFRMSSFLVFLLHGSIKICDKVNS